jgi:hypothetical protein
MDEIIVVTAKAGTWVREIFTPKGLVRMFGEGLISDYAEKMSVLREVDNNIEAWSKELSLLLEQMEASFKSKRLVDLATLAHSINEKLKNVSLEGLKVKQLTDEALKEFESEQEFDLPKELYKKQAGLWSDLTRKWVAKKLETQNRIKRNKDLERFISVSKNLLNSIQELINQLHKHRAYGEIGKYLDILAKISLKQKEFENSFKKVYNEHLRSFVLDAVQKNKAQEASQVQMWQPKFEKEPEIPVFEGQMIQSVPPMPQTAPEELKSDLPKSEPMPESKPNIPESSPALIDVPSQVPGITVKKVVPPDPKTLGELVKKPQAEKAEPKSEKAEPEKAEPEKTELEKALEKSVNQTKSKEAKHILFLEKLASCTDKYQAAQEILAYSAEIEDNDLVSSLKLISIAEGLLDE